MDSMNHNVVMTGRAGDLTVLVNTRHRPWMTYQESSVLYKIVSVHSSWQ